jgi:hypothetical protein
VFALEHLQPTLGLDHADTRSAGELELATRVAGSDAPPRLASVPARHPGP